MKLKIYRLSLAQTPFKILYTVSFKLLFLIKPNIFLLGSFTPVFDRVN